MQRITTITITKTVIFSILSILFILPQLVSANHFSEKEINNQLKELDSYLQSGEMTKEDYQTKKNWLYKIHEEQDLTDSDTSKSIISILWSFLGITILISLIIFGTIHYRKQKNTKSYNDWRNSEILAELITSWGNKANPIEIWDQYKYEVERKLETSWITKSIGFVEIIEGPIKWANITYRSRSDRTPPQWKLILGIPDNTVPLEHDKVDLRPKRKRTFPLFGKVIGVEWKGNDFGLGLLGRYRDDSFINDTIAKIGKLQSIETHPDIYQGWTIDLRYINEDLWKLSQKIAKYNLDSHR
tara:strand:- start:418 stop:1317 length:900 start_codon:yes stop_codon:yes gene_type:complete